MYTFSEPPAFTHEDVCWTFRNDENDDVALNPRDFDNLLSYYLATRKPFTVTEVVSD